MCYQCIPPTYGHDHYTSFMQECDSVEPLLLEEKHVAACPSTLAKQRQRTTSLICEVDTKKLANERGCRACISTCLVIGLYINMSGYRLRMSAVQHGQSVYHL